MHRTRWTILPILLAVLLSGCSQAPGSTLQRLDSHAPGASGYAPPSPSSTAAPLREQPPFGLFVDTPTSDTLQRLSTGERSPDGRFRAALTGQGSWVGRVDGAWLWQIQYTAPQPTGQPPAATTPPPAQGTPPAQPQAPLPTTIVGPLRWSPRNTVLFQDENGNWHEGDPQWATTKQLPALLAGKESLAYSPDSTQVLYYTPGPAGRQLWVSKADGTSPRLLGTGVVGSWDEAGNPVVRQLTITKTQPRSTLFQGGRLRE